MIYLRTTGRWPFKIEIMRAPMATLWLHHVLVQRRPARETSGHRRSLKYRPSLWRDAGVRETPARVMWKELLHPPCEATGLVCKFCGGTILRTSSAWSRSGSCTFPGRRTERERGPDADEWVTWSVLTGQKALPRIRRKMEEGEGRFITSRVYLRNIGFLWDAWPEKQ